MSSRFCLDFSILVTYLNSNIAHFSSECLIKFCLTHILFLSHHNVCCVPYGAPRGLVATVQTCTNSIP